MNSYIRCGKAYELGKLGVKEAPAWWLIGGSAVHKATEWLDTGEWDDSPEMAFYTAFNNEIFDAEDTEPDQGKWRKAGYGARAQGREHWMVQGPRYVKRWADRDQEWEWVELDVSTTLPSGIEIKAYIDRARVDRTIQGFQIADLKTGSTRPDSDQQLGIYSVLFDIWLNTHGTQYTRTFQGNSDISAWNYMFKDDEFYLMETGTWTLEAVDEMAKEWYDGISSGVFLPNRGKQCGTCGVSSGCFLQSGDSPLTRQYDKLNPNYGD
jgi:hypothetical protein